MLHDVEQLYFVSGVRGLIRDNAVARLWWMGHIASRCKDYGFEETLDIILSKSDVRANLLERSSLSMSEEIFGGVVRALGKSFYGNKKLYERGKFRLLMRWLNRRGGRIMLNSLNKKQLDKLIDDKVQDIVNQTNV